MIATTFSCWSCSTRKSVLVTPSATRPTWIGSPSVQRNTSSRPSSSTCRTTRRPVPSYSNVSPVPSGYTTDRGLPRQFRANDVTRSPKGPGMVMDETRPSASRAIVTGGRSSASIRDRYPPPS